MSTVESIIRRDSGGSLEHPAGLLLKAPAQSFKADTRIKVTRLAWRGFGGVPLSEHSFAIELGDRADKPMVLAVRVPHELVQSRKGPFFLSIDEGTHTCLVAANLVKRGSGQDTTHHLEAVWQAAAVRATVAAGAFDRARGTRVFHPVPHYFKNGELGTDEDGNCRREGSDECATPPPQAIYPACLPAGVARLFGAYRLVLPADQRRWYVGTPTQPDPPPDEAGDPFSTQAVGVTGRRNPSRVEDWTTGTEVELESLRFGLAAGVPEDDAVAQRASLIRGAIETLVRGGGSPSDASVPVPRALYMYHRGHGWNVVGVDRDGYWAHGQNPDSASLSDWCLWEKAPWADAERERPEYWIQYPRDCVMRPEGRRMGSLSMWGSGGRANSVQFVDLDTPARASIDWTPHKEASSVNAGYIWIEDGTRLNERGIPLEKPIGVWDDELGWRVPVPKRQRSDCCGSRSQGCRRCRTRLHLPFWVHNTTLDQLLTYRLELSFWTADGRWVALPAQSMAAREDGTYPGFPTFYPDRYAMPGPLPGEPFTIRATPDATNGPAGAHPYNWQPVAWRIDLDRNQLRWWTTHGIRIQLRCVDNCEIQDTVQFWFKTRQEEVW